MENDRIMQWTALGGLALALGLAFSAGSASVSAAASAPAWAAEVELGVDHIDGVEFAEALLNAPDSLLVIDLRRREEFDLRHLPGALHFDLPRLLGPEGAELLAAHPHATVVLLSNGMTHPAQAWTELRSRGHSRVRVLEEGLEGFAATCLTPPALLPGVEESQARALQPRFEALRALVLGEREEGGSLAQPEQAPQTAGAAPAQPFRWATDPVQLERPTVVSADWLRAKLGTVLVLDARDKAEAYASGHVPGALRLDVTGTRAPRDGVEDELLPQAELAKVVGALGIDRNTPVVVYGDERLQDPTHVLLALYSLGHRRMALLEGGLPAWRGAGGELSAVTPAAVASVYEPVPGADAFRVGLTEVERACSSGTAALLDVRPGEAFRGEGKSSEARAGHIPGSLQREYKLDVDTFEGGLYFKSREELRAAYANLGLSAQQPVIVSCRTGHQASQTWFALQFLLGYENVSWYDGSWKEWAAHPELPVEVGPARSITNQK